MLTCVEVLRGLALAEAGPTAAPTATVLMTSAAAMATRVRVKDDCDDILISLSTGSVACGPMNKANQGACQSRKTAKNTAREVPAAKIPNQELVRNPKRLVGTFTTSGASNPGNFFEE